MENKYDAGIFKRFALGLALCLSALALMRPAVADVPPPPPPPPAYNQTISGTPNGVPLHQTVNGPYGRVTVEIPRGALDSRFSNVSSGSGGNLNGFRNMPSQFTDGYGNVARGSVRTQTQLPQTSAVAKFGAAYYGAGVAGSALNHQGAPIGEALAQGRYGEAAQLGVLGLLQGFRSVGDGILFGGISGAEGAIDAYKNAKNPMKNPIDELMRQQYQRNQETAKRYEQQFQQSNGFQDYLPDNSGKPKVYPTILIVQGGNLAGVYFLPPDFKGAAGGSYNTGISINLGNGQTFTLGSPCFNGCDAGNSGQFHTVRTNAQNYQQNLPHIQQAIAQAQRPPSAQEFLPTQAEIVAALEKALNQMLQDNRRNNTDLINALVGAGLLNGSGGKTSVIGTAGENTFLTEPFTPLGSNTAQQTKFVVNPDGSVTVSTVQRPDLAANTSQAPARQQVGQTAGSTGQTNPQPPAGGSTAEKPDVCAQNPRSLMCADLGSGDYTDPVLPTQTRGLDFNPSGIFGDSGFCPAPKVIAVFKTQVSLSYEPTCDIATKLRPIVVLLGMAAAMWMVWGAVNE